MSSPTIRLKRCEAVYKELCNRENARNIRTSDREEKKTEKTLDKGKPPLNEYQKFVQKESQKSKYNKLSGKEKLSAIAKAWKKKKRI